MRIERRGEQGRGVKIREREEERGRGLIWEKRREREGGRGGSNKWWGVGTKSGAFNTDMSGFTSAVNETLMELQG